MAVESERAASGAQAGPSGSHGARKRKGAEAKARLAKYRRGTQIATKKLSDKKLRTKMAYSNQLAHDAAVKSAKVEEWLLPSEAGTLEAEGMERTYKFKQAEILEAVEAGAAAKAIDLRLPELGPYTLGFTRNGRHMLLGGRKGHLALMDWSRSQLVTEVQVSETVRDVTLLHNECFFAAAQKKYAYIYDKRGLEVHCLRDHLEPHALAFLPKHFLLSSIGAHGIVRWQDTSTGKLVAQHRTKLGACGVLKVNPWNAVLHAGHANGTVTMWTPNISKPVVKMLTNQGPVTSMAIDATGRYMATAAADRTVRIWDVRTYRELHGYAAYSPAMSLDISQRGLLAVGSARKVEVWKDALQEKTVKPYMVHQLPHGRLQTVEFCPYEDVLALGHSEGVATILVPGAGEPNFDSLVANPFASKKERQNAEVANLLDKLQPDSIVLDPDSVGRIRKEPKEVVLQKQAEAAAARAEALKEAAAKNDAKAKMKGKNRPSRRHRKKQLNIIEERKGDVKKDMRDRGAATAEHGGRYLEQAARTGDGKDVVDLAEVPRSLHRFYKKS